MCVTSSNALCSKHEVPHAHSKPMPTGMTTRDNLSCSEGLRVISAKTVLQSSSYKISTVACSAKVCSENVVRPEVLELINADNKGDDNVDNVLLKLSRAVGCGVVSVLVLISIMMMSIFC